MVKDIYITTEEYLVSQEIRHERINDNILNYISKP